MYRLKNARYQSYLVGGGVRDLLLGRYPKDFDIATAAKPEEVRAVFSNCRLIGRRFRLAHVLFGNDIIEVATFRGKGEEGADSLSNDSGRLLRDNVYGTMEEDAWRRDFTVNALYYSVEDFAIYDYVGGMEDLNNRLLRLIGDPEVRYREDPVRMLRAVRFAAKLDFDIDKETEAGIHRLHTLLKDTAPARMFDEFQKLFFAGHAARTFDLLRHFGLLKYLLPEAESVFAAEGEDGPALAMARAVMVATDERIAAGKSVTPAFLLAAILWFPMCRRQQALIAQGMRPADALHRAISEITDDEAVRLSIPKRFRLPMAEIWQMQSRFEHRRGKRVLQLLLRPRFRGAYDFLLLRAKVGDAPVELAQWWTRFQEVDETQQEQMLNDQAKLPLSDQTTGTGRLKPRRGRRRGPRKRSAEPT